MKKISELPVIIGDIVAVRSSLTTHPALTHDPIKMRTILKIEEGRMWLASRDVGITKNRMTGYVGYIIKGYHVRNARALLLIEHEEALKSEHLSSCKRTLESLIRNVKNIRDDYNSQTVRRASRAAANMRLAKKLKREEALNVDPHMSRLEELLEG